MASDTISIRGWLEHNGYTPTLCKSCNGYKMLTCFDERGNQTDTPCRVCGGSGILLEKVEVKTTLFNYDVARLAAVDAVAEFGSVNVEGLIKELEEVKI